MTEHRGSDGEAGDAPTEHAPTEHAPAEPAAGEGRRRGPRLVGPLIVLAVIVGAAAIGLWDEGPGGEDPDAEAASSSAPARTLGDRDAPVTLIEYSDFGCQFCQAHHDEVFGDLVASYVDPGDVRYVWRDFPVQGPGSERAAIAGIAAAEQGAFWDLHEALFAHGVGPGTDADDLRAVADEAGLDGDAIAGAVDSDAYDEAVAGELASGQSVGVSGTPAFVLLGGGQDPELLPGFRQLDDLAERIEARLDHE